MLPQALLLAALCLVSAVTAQLTPSYCDALNIKPCFQSVPRDIMFLVDGSNSMDVDRFYGSVLNYTLIIYCAFDETHANKAGMILFNERVEVLIPLEVYTRNIWYNKVWEVKNSRYGPTPACCSCCTPTADAMQLANAHFDSKPKNEVQITFIITDGVPSNNNAQTGGNPAWWWHDAVTGFDPSLYATQSVPEMATLLKNNDRRVILVGVPNYDNVPPDAKYFNGGYPNGYNYCTKRAGVNFCTKYYTNPANFPLVSLPVSLNSFSVTKWDDEVLMEEILGAICTSKPSASPTKMPFTLAPTQKPTSAAPTTTPRPTEFPTSQAPTKLPTSQAPTSQSPTKLPTSQSPTKLPTSQAPTKMPTSKSPTSKSPSQSPSVSPTGVYLEQVDLTFLVDRSNSMTYYPALCQNVLDTFPPSQGAVSQEPCWQLWTQYMMNQAQDMTEIPAGPHMDHPLRWADYYQGGSTPAKGLRVTIVGFACENKQKSPKMYDYSVEINGGPITSLAQMNNVIEVLRSSVTPFGGTCPHLAVEQAIKHLEATNEEKYPLQTVILMTDGVFYDGDAVPRATKGLRAYKALTYAIGVAVAQGGNTYGMTPEEIATQRKQLSAFVNNDPLYFYNIRNGWDGLLEVTDVIANQLPQYFFGNQNGKPIKRYTWCGFRRLYNCGTDGWRMGNCKWSGKANAQYKCRRV